MVERGGAQGGTRSGSICAEHVGAAVLAEQVHGSAGIGVIDKQTVGVLAVSVVVGEYGEAKKNEGEKKEREPLCRYEFLAVVGDIERGGEQ